MIGPAVANSLRHTFRDHAGETLFYRLQKMYALDRERRLEEEQQAKEADADLDAFAGAMASMSDIDAFKVDLDRYDVATVTALEANERALAVVLKQQDAMLAKAHVLPDGRRVFKTEDGTAVYDEAGLAVNATTVTPDAISDDRPSWENFKPLLDAKVHLSAERRQLIAYQDKLDQARERLDAGDVSRVEFEKMKQALKDDMPEAVRTQIPELAKEAATPASVPHNGLDFSEAAVPTSLRQYPAPRAP